MDWEPARGSLLETFAAHADAPRLDLGAALIAAHEQPWLSVPGLLDHLDRLARGLHLPDGEGVVRQVARLNHHLFARLGFRGQQDDYDAPFHSYLDRVLESRRGLPILLSIVWLEVGRRAGFAGDGVAFPGHFLVAPRGASPRFFVDPFDGGAIRTHGQLAMALTRQGAEQPQIDTILGPAQPKAVLVRVNQNLKGAFLRRRDDAGALRAVERIRALQPDAEEPWREQGLLLARLGRQAEARALLDRWLDRHSDHEDAVAVAQLMDQLRGG